MFIDACVLAVTACMRAVLCSAGKEEIKLNDRDVCEAFIRCYAECVFIWDFAVLNVNSCVLNYGEAEYINIFQYVRSENDMVANDID